ncbi:unnamed protein product [Mortierella alpina]
MSQVSPVTCDECDPPRTFGSSEQKRMHVTEYHSKTFTVVVDRGGILQEIEVTQVDGVYKCPPCQAEYKTKTGCRKHILSNICVENEDTTPDSALAIISMPDELAIPLPPIPDVVSVSRTHEDAVLYSCQQGLASEAEKKRILCIVQALDLEPFAITDGHGAEQNALAHPSVIKRLSFGQVSINPTLSVPRKRKLDDAEACWRCSPIPSAGLEHLMSVSPYAGSLLTRKYVELNDNICELLNRDWRFSLLLRFACSKILSGCILLNTSNNQAILANTVEVYGRTRMVDAHREPFIVRKGCPVANSLPPSVNTSYKEVWPLTVVAPEGERLVIGTGTFDDLITSSLRLDDKVEASVGGIIPSFLLTGAEQSKATKIFLDQESLDVGLNLAGNKEAWAVSGRDLMSQLRQTKTKFHDPSTYYLCRSSSHFAKNHPCQPYTIFTLASFDQAANGDGSAVSHVFDTIASSIVQCGSKAALAKESMMQLRGRCTNHSNAVKEVDGILTLYGPEELSLPILGNQDLNKHLETLAQLLSPYVSKANKSVVSFIEKEFSLRAI